MSTTAASPFVLDGRFARELPELALAWGAAPTPAPELAVLNGDLAAELGLDPAALATPEGVQALLGHALPEGATPVAQAYAGHQFGGWSPRLGDGRALLLGELRGPDGASRDLHLKGSGRTPFARGGDGRAALGPMLREHVIGEAMHALGVPTSRALAVIASGEDVARDAVLPGAVLVRVASSHLRVGMFQYARGLEDPTVLRRLADHAIARHHPSAADAENPYLALYEAVLGAQASLVARWMGLGFVHGVLNTDNVAISGESMDYGPCAFVDVHDPLTVFSSIDQQGRYAYGKQPDVTAWNLARLAEALLPLIDEEQEAAVEAATSVLQTWPQRYREARDGVLHAKLGLGVGEPEDGTLVDDLLELMTAQAVDHTAGFRALSAALRGDDGRAHARVADDPAAFDAWAVRWRGQLEAHGIDPAAAADGMDAVNPVYVPRNHLVEEALAAATAGDLGPYEELVAVVSDPFRERPGRERFAEPAPPGFAGGYRTFCGT